jgi:hypothetical protein
MEKQQQQFSAGSRLSRCRRGRIRRMLGGGAAVGFVLTVAGISLTLPAWPQAVEHKPRFQSHSAMEHEMDRFRADLVALREAMNRFRELCRRERQAALKPHLERVRDNMDRALAMEEQMQQDLNRGRMVSDSDLRHRIRLLGEQVRMLIEMNALALEEAERPDCSNP